MNRITNSSVIRKSVSWLRKNLFSSPVNILLTVTSLWLVIITLVPLVEWAIVDAQWRGATPGDCPNKEAACWPFVRARFGQFMFGLYPEGERWRVILGFAIGLAALFPLFIPRFPFKRWLIMFLIFCFPFIAIVLFSGGILGLDHVETTQWGGFFLTLVVSSFVMAMSLPLGILLGLGRQSSMPLIRVLCSGWVEFWRAVPALVVLFVAIIMFPLFMPDNFEIDKLLRALIAFTLLMSAYLAEAVRGALQALSRGQYEAADALGLTYWQTMRLIILPQALVTATPQITSNFIGLFKETTILLVIGLYDLLGMVQSAAADPAWLGRGVVATGYVFAAAFFWIFCFTMSRYSAHLERKYGVER